MKAVGLVRFGGPEVLRVVELPEPHAGAGQVRIRVRAAAVNPVDALIRTGASAVRRHGSEPVIPGLDVAGSIDEAGPGTSLRPGDEVMAMVNPTRPAGGGYAEWVVLPESWVVPIPAGTSFTEAATLPMSGLTALRALDVLRLPPGSTVAVTGAAGLVGGYAVQLAKAAGHHVLADAAPSDRDLVLGLGADVVIPRGPAIAQVPGGVDAVIDAAGIGTPALAALRPGGSVVHLREAPAVDDRLVFAFVHDYDGRTDKLHQLRTLVEDGRLTPRPGPVFRPEQAAEAHRRLEAGGTRGRIILEF